MDKSICEIVREMEQNYINGSTTISKYVQFNQYENINKIDAYLNSKHISGDVDSLDREKPFFNIVTGAVNIWYRATDIDRKNIRIKATKRSDYIGAFLATIHLQEWMRREAFGTFLNEWGRTLARYGSAVLKFVEKDGRLVPLVVPWNRVVCDTVDFDNNVKIEKLYLTPAQLKRNKYYDQDTVKNLLDNLQSRETLDGQTRDNKNDYVELYEVHGEIELCYLTDKETDQDKYQQQVHVVSFVANADTGEYEDYTLYRGKESKDPYMITHLIKEEGRTQSIGAVEHLFESQWMQNHTAKAIKDQLDLASQLIFQTSDGSFVGRNMLTNIMTGDIVIHAENQPLTQVANNSHDITALQNFAAQWKVLAQDVTSTPDAIRGNTQPSGTPYALGSLLSENANSLFELMTENKGLHIETMMREYVIPFLEKKMDSTEEIAATLDSEGITQFDALYISSEVNRRDNQQLISHILSPEFTKLGTPLAQNLDPNQVSQDIQKDLSTLGEQRFIKPSHIPSKTWKEVFKDLEWAVDVIVTNESTDKQAVMTTLTTVLQTIAANPAVLTDPNMRMLFNQILEETGTISAVQLSQASAQPQPQLQSQLPQEPTQLTKQPSAQPNY